MSILESWDENREVGFIKPFQLVFLFNFSGKKSKSILLFKIHSMDIF